MGQRKQEEDKNTEVRKSVMTDMRRLCSLFVDFKDVWTQQKKSSAMPEIKDMFKRTNFPVLEETIFNNSSDNGKVKPGLKIALAYVLKTASKIMKASFLMDDKDEEAAEIDKFVAVLNLNHNYVFGDAQYLLQKGRQIKSQAWNPTPGFGLVFGLVLVYWGLTPQQQPGSYQGGEMMMKSVFWWRKPEHPEETTDPWQVTDETFHTYGLCPVRGLNLGRSGVKQSELRRDESGALARRATAVPLLPQEADVQKVRTYTVETVKGLLKDEYMQWSAHEYIKLRE